MKKITFAIKMLGCKVNQYESQVLRENLKRFGYGESGDKNADTVIINSCTVTDRADLKTLRAIKKIRKDNPGAKIVITGCYAVSRDDIKHLKATPGVHVVPNDEKLALPLFLNKIYGVRSGEERIHERVSGFARHTRAFVKIQDGCDQECAYCKVRIVRGSSQSRDKKEILAEVTRLVGAGHKEIVVTGICVGEWEGQDKERLPDLLSEMGALPGAFRVRLSSIEPNHVTDRLIKIISHGEKMCRHLHIPLQSGSDGVLGRMKRRYNVPQFRERIAKIRSYMPLAGISMDIIAGFPGETAEDFSRSVELIQELKPSRIHVFRYSDRKGTLSNRMADKVPFSVSGERVRYLIDVGRKLQTEFYREFIGRKVQVLVEKRERAPRADDPRASGLSGYTSEYVKVALSGFNGREGELVLAEPEELDEKIPCLLAQNTSAPPGAV